VTPVLADQASENKQVVLRMTEAINNREFDILDELMAPDLRRHSAATPTVKVESLEQFKNFLHQDLAACPDATQVELPFIGILRLAEGKIAEIWVEWDNLNALSQLGHFPPSENNDADNEVKNP
jgi:hypothetical protein